MAKKSLEERMSHIEGQFAGKTLEEHFREQAELIDRLFAYRFEELDRKLDPLKKDVMIVREGVAILLKR